MLKNNLRWKPIEGYENLYLISEEGDVWSIKRGKMLKPRVNSNGYLLVSLCKNGKGKNYRVHRLVAEAFIDNPDPDKLLELAKKNPKKEPLYDKKKVRYDLKCKNVRCISSVEQEHEHKFMPTSKKGEYKCIYCEQTVKAKK